METDKSFFFSSRPLLSSLVRKICVKTSYLTRGAFKRVSAKSGSVDFWVLLSQFSIQNLGAISTYVYCPQILNRKLAKIIPKIDEPSLCRHPLSFLRALFCKTCPFKLTGQFLKNMVYRCYSID